MRDLELYVASDCVAALTKGEHCSALDQMRTLMKARVAVSTELDLVELGT